MNKKTLCFVVSKIKGYKLFITETSFVLLVKNCVMLLIPFLTKLMIDEGLIEKDVGLFVKLALVTFVVGVVLEFNDLVFQYLQTVVFAKMGYQIKKDLFGHIVGSNLEYFDNSKVGENLLLLESSNVFTNIVNMFLFNFLNNIFLICLSIFGCWHLNNMATLVLIGFLPLFMIYYWKVGRIAKLREVSVWDKNRDIYSFSKEALSGVKTIKMLSVEDKIIRKYGHFLLVYINRIIHFEKRFIRLSIIRTLIANAENVIVILVCGYLIIENRMTLGEYFAFQMLSSRVFDPLKSILRLNEAVQKHSVRAEKIYQVANTPSEINGFSCKFRIDRIDKIEFDNVTFAYNEKVTLKNITFTLNRDEVLYIVGDNGSGKSTIANLLYGLYHPQKGEIKVNDITLKDIDIYDYRKKIGFLAQKPAFFSGTMKENLDFVKRMKTDDIVKLSRSYGLEAFTEKIYQNTDISEHQQGISGGEFQRLALIRSLMRDPQMIIYDEPTNHLDRDSLDIFNRMIQQSYEGKIVVMITHDHSFLKNKDKVLFMQNGRAVNIGTHEELLSGCSSYIPQRHSIKVAG